jgi:hypothetical protein
MLKITGHKLVVRNLRGGKKSFNKFLVVCIVTIIGYNTSKRAYIVPQKMLEETHPLSNKQYGNGEMLHN